MRLLLGWLWLWLLLMLLVLLLLGGSRQQLDQGRARLEPRSQAQHL